MFSGPYNEIQLLEFFICREIRETVILNPIVLLLQKMCGNCVIRNPSYKFCHQNFEFSPVRETQLLYSVNFIFSILLFVKNKLINNRVLMINQENV